MTTNDLEQRPEGNWGSEIWRKPALKHGDIELFSECGRVLNKIDYRSHWFALVKSSSEISCTLLVKHGGGEERVNLGFTSSVNAIKSFSLLDSDSRYLTMHLLYRVHTEATRNAQEATRFTYNQAFVEGRLKKRKQRGTNRVKVWIDSPSQSITH